MPEPDPTASDPPDAQSPGEVPGASGAAAASVGGTLPGGIRLVDLVHEWPGGRKAPAVRTFDRVSLDVAAGSVVALVGPSGCGKSTLLRVLAGITTPTSGTVSIGDVDVAGRPGSAAWMPQHHNLLPWRRVLANAVLGAEIGGVPRSEAEARARPLLERFGLGGFERAWPGQLSGGMRQRLAVLRTVLIDAPVMLLDEPFGALDALTRRGMHRWFQEVLSADSSVGRVEGAAAAHRRGVVHGHGGSMTTAGPGDQARRTVLLVTHDVEEALVLADRVVVMSARPGRVVADVAVPFDRPRSPDLVTDPTFTALRASLLASLGA